MMLIRALYELSADRGRGGRKQLRGIANSPAHTAVRDSTTPARAALTFPAGAFAVFPDGVKGYSTVTDFARFRG
ncbi:DUF397 domain-containing protein [Streptomyces sp. Qhu-G9]|uniref:DUF397 domain-containing protein n=1 Tax=Streptomyces sp. Qhu-G9 TaxID=3452799 RepID=UPI0022AC5296|nr:DUF397 domain-containing protein [Streptomyces aurantiacus]WAU79255.1 DUF397 domain-containing protein [Streptomyces aurantiacus]